MSTTGNREHKPPPKLTAILQALRTTHPRYVSRGPGHSVLLPGLTAVDVARAIGSYPEAVRDHLVLLVRQHTLEVVHYGPYICYRFVAGPDAAA